MQKSKPSQTPEVLPFFFGHFKILAVAYHLFSQLFYLKLWEITFHEDKENVIVLSDILSSFPVLQGGIN